MACRWASPPISGQRPRLSCPDGDRGAFGGGRAELCGQAGARGRRLSRADRRADDDRPDPGARRGRSCGGARLRLLAATSRSAGPGQRAGSGHRAAGRRRARPGGARHAEQPVGPMLVAPPDLRRPRCHGRQRGQHGRGGAGAARWSAITGGRVGLRILSNLADRRLARAGAVVPGAAGHGGADAARRACSASSRPTPWPPPTPTGPRRTTRGS